MMDNVTSYVTTESYFNISDGGGRNMTDLEAKCYSVFEFNTTSSILSHEIYLFSSLILVCLGLIGNFLSVAVFSSKDMRCISSNVYLLLLAISDSMYLLSVLFYKLLTHLRCLFLPAITSLDIANMSSFLCISLQCLVDYFSDYSTCLIMAFTIERFIAVYLPHRFKEICTVKRARVNCIAIFMVIMIIIPYHIMYMGFFNEKYKVCAIIENYHTIFSILYFVESLLFRIIPVFLIFILNIFIIKKITFIAKEKKRRKSICKPLKPGSRHAQREDKSMQLTILLILVSSTYIICYIPTLIHFTIDYLHMAKVIEHSREVMETINNFFKITYIFGFASNFLLYTMSGQVFRSQLAVILCGNMPCKKMKNNQIEIKHINSTCKQTVI